MIGSGESGDGEAGVRDAEQRLRVAMLASDVEALAELIDDRLLFLGPDGRVYRKGDDLALHRSGAQRFTRIDLVDVAVELHGPSMALSVVLSELAGTARGQPFEGSFRYSRTWVRGARGWVVVGGSVCAVSDPVA